MTRFSVIWCFVALIVSGRPSWAGEGGATDVGGGGQVVVVDGVTTLLDLVDESNCFWRPARELEARLLHFPAILASLDGVHPLLSVHVAEEIEKLAVCELSVPLRRIDTSDSIQSVVDTDAQGRTVAIRWNDRIYLDRALFDELGEVEKAYLFFHEVMHRFIAMDVPRRNQSLRSFVSAVRKNELEPMGYDAFALQARMNSVSVPLLKQPEIPGWIELRAQMMDQMLDQRPDPAARVQAFRTLSICDPALGFLPESWRTPENLRAYRLSRALLGDACLGAVSPGDVWLETLCEAGSSDRLDQWASAGSDLWMMGAIAYDLEIRGRPQGSCVAQSAEIERIITIHASETLTRLGPDAGFQWLGLLAQTLRPYVYPRLQQARILPALITMGFERTNLGREVRLQTLVEAVSRDLDRPNREIVADWVIQRSRGGIGLNEENAAYVRKELFVGNSSVRWQMLAGKSPYAWGELLDHHARERLPTWAVLAAANARSVGYPEFLSDVRAYVRDPQNPESARNHARNWLAALERP